MKRYLLFFLLGFAGFSSANSENIEILCTYIEGSENKLTSYSTQKYFKDGASPKLSINLKEQTVIFNDSGWKYLAISEGKKISINTRFLVNENQVPQDVSNVFDYWIEASIDRQTGILFLKNYSEQENKGDYKLSITKKYQCNSFEFKF